jgi:hypothetical protein
MGVPFAAPQGRALQDPIPADRILFGETGASEGGYWAAGHRSYSFKRSFRRYTVDPPTGRVYQRPEYVSELVLAKDRWVADDEFWLTEEALESRPRYQLFRWREDPTMGTDVSLLYPDDLLRLKTALEMRPRFPTTSATSTTDGASSTGTLP